MFSIMLTSTNVSERLPAGNRQRSIKGTVSVQSCESGQLDLELGTSAGERRVACVILPELACELARWAATNPARQLPLPQATAQPDKSKRCRAASAGQNPRPFGVVLMDGIEQNTTLVELNRSVEPTFRLSAVDIFARRLGIEEGQTIAEARCLHAALEVSALPRRQIAETLTKLAESLLDRASIVAVEAPDTIWLEIGSVMRAFGGQAVVAKEILERVRCLGHAARLAVASGPRLAQLFARWAARGRPEGLLVPRTRALEVACDLPLAALPLDRERLGFLGRLGLVKLGDLQRLPEGELVQRLGPDAGRFIALARGEDNEPLFAIQPERVLRERLEWEEPIEGIEPLRFALRRLTTNIESRLSARGEAAERLSITLQHDRGIARYRGVPPETHLHFEFARPLWYAEDLERIIVARCERTHMGAPSVALELRVVAPTPKVPKQLELSRISAGYGASALAEEGLPVLLAELEVDIGIERVGLLRLADSHRPELKSLFSPYRLDEEKSRISRKKAQRKACPPRAQAQMLPSQPDPMQQSAADPTAEYFQPARPTSPVSGEVLREPGRNVLELREHRKSSKPQAQSGTLWCPLREVSGNSASGDAWERPPSTVQTLEGITRLLERPIVIEQPIRVGATVFLEHQAYVIERMRFEERLDGLEWWGKSPISRDYWRVYLRGATGGLEALIYVEPHQRRCFLQALVD
jgi:protein ImuB